MSDIYETISSRIIKEQVTLIGPIALEVASKVESLSVEVEANSFAVHINTEDKSSAVDALITRFEALFGKVSVNVSKDAVKSLLKEIPANEVPSKLA